MLTRRDRCVLELALHDLRERHPYGGPQAPGVALPRALDTLLRGDVPSEIRRAVFRAWGIGDANDRVMRCRLALLLRAVLRADTLDRIDAGEVHLYDPACCWGCVRHWEPITPLWEQASKAGRT